MFLNFIVAILRKQKTAMVNEAMRTDDEKDLNLLLKRKDELTFNYLYDNYAGALYRIVLQAVPDKELANEILPEVFINIWHRLETFDTVKKSLFTWMLNTAVDYIKFHTSELHQGSDSYGKRNFGGGIFF